ncbi:MAG TPA: ABC transporter ATP-binding protein [Alphaproteobacteria bacterium]|nr:ABC transporter ATP-binding protein [Alphaproteobacteria bacterium]
MSPPTVVFDGVSKYFRTQKGRRWVLYKASFALRRGQNIGILGQNGAGKSTLLRMICGMEPPSSGEIRRFAPISWPLGLGGSAQGSLTGAENAKFVARIYGAPVEEVVEFVRDFSELGPAIDVPVRTYSAGMRARLTFGMSMALKFRCYLIDELTAVGDQNFRKKCIDTFAERREDSDVIIVSHQPATIRAYAESVIVLNQGEFHFFADIDEGFYYYNQLR